MARAGHSWCRKAAFRWHFGTGTRVNYRTGEVQTHPVSKVKVPAKKTEAFRANGRPRKRLWHMRPGLRPALPHPRDRLRQNATGR